MYSPTTKVHIAIDYQLFSRKCTYWCRSIDGIDTPKWISSKYDETLFG